MATLHLMVGLPCSGKTTQAKKLEQELPALRLTPDEWHLKLFGDDASSELHDIRHNAIEDIIWNTTKKALSLGINVIMDFGFWAKEERDYFRAEAQKLGADCKIHYMAVPFNELLSRLEVRNKTAGVESNVFNISEDMMREWHEIFQEPDENEYDYRYV